ncbi:MAG: hypothetical protein QM751_11125 [Paludibacteraceae bacterium]
MEKNKFEVILPLKIQDLISLIIEKKNLEFENALDYLYISKLYKILSNEESKIWHLSSEKLFDILEVEKETNKLKLPDFV